VLDQFQKLYLLEGQIRNKAMDWQRRTGLKKKHAEPILENLDKWWKKNNTTLDLKA